MSEPLPFTGIDLIVARTSNSSKANADLTSLVTQFKHGWPSIAAGITLAGGVYPLVVAVIVIAFGEGVIMWSDLVSTRDDPIEIADLFSAVAMVAFFAFFGTLAGILWSNLVALLVFPLVYLFVWSLRLRGSIIWLGAVCGGFVGLIAALPISFDQPGNVWDTAASLGLGPGLATVLGQLGGAWGGRRAVRGAWYRRRAALAMIYRELNPDEQLSGGDDAGAAALTKRRWQFGIRHLLWSSVWVSLLLCAIRLSGVSFQFAMPLLLGWLVYQAAILWIGWLLARRLAPKWTARRQSRST